MAMTYGGMMYFPLKVNFFDEIPMELVEAKFGLKGIAATMKLLCKIHKDNGYYLVWDEEQCTLFANKVGRDIHEEEMQGIVDILTEKGVFDLKTYKEKRVLTSANMQKVWLDATKRRKKEEGQLPYWLIENIKNEKEEKEKEKQKEKEEKEEKERAMEMEMEKEMEKREDKGVKGEPCMQNQADCTLDVNLFTENAYNFQQSKVEQIKEKERKVLPLLAPPGESGETGAKSVALDIPGYAYNKKTHNLECLFLSLKQLRITDPQDVQKILKLSDYGRLGGSIWKIIHDTNWSKVNCKGGYMIAILAKERRKT